MNLPDFEGAQRHAFERLERELACDLVYHSLRHTRDDVLTAVQRLAAMEGLGAEETRLLSTAAAYHDIGFIERYSNHEAAGVRIVEQTLPEFGFSTTHILTIQNIIWATKLPQTPHNLLEQIMADADLDVLGRTDFFERNHDLRAELALYAKPVPDHEWYSRQMQFLANHRYFTPAGRLSRSLTKQHNIDALAARQRMSPVEQY